MNQLFRLVTATRYLKLYTLNKKGYLLKTNVFAVTSIILITLIVGCATVPMPKRTFTDQAIWSKVTKDKAYTACLTTLQMQGYDIHPLSTSKESGLIIAEHDKFTLIGDVTGHYKLQILISEMADNKIMIDLNVKAGYRVAAAWATKETVKIKLNNRIAGDVDELFAQLDILLGEAEYYRSNRTLE